MEAEDQSKKKYEQKNIRDDDGRLKGLRLVQFLFVQFWHLSWITSITSI